MLKRTLSILFATLLVFATSISSANDIIKMTSENGLNTLPCEVNGIRLKFIFDTGASRVSISTTEAVFMLKNGIINKNDFKSSARACIANGDIAEGQILNLRELKIGNRIFYNVEAFVSNSPIAPLLLGQNVIRQLGEWSIVNDCLILRSNRTNDVDQSHQNYYDPLYKEKKAAEQGDANAQFNLGLHYYNTRNYQQAVNWYKKAAKQGNIKAQNYLGICYEQGLGVPRNYEQAMYWYQSASERGDGNAHNNLMMLYEKFDANTQYNMGVGFYTGKGVSKNYAKAAYLFKLAAEKGQVKAQYNLGFCYSKGIGVSQSYEMAAYWWKKAAEQSDVNAQYNMGECYYNGNGVKQSYIEAIKWYIKAAKQDHSKAKSTLIKFLIFIVVIIIAVRMFFKTKK